MAQLQPFNITILDVDKIVKDEMLREVTSEFIRESSSNKFHPEGLFSEQIFGEVASQERFSRCGYINLNCKVFHPVIYQDLKAIKRFYIEILSGVSYAVWDPEANDFARASEEEENAQTGFAFFLKYFDKIDLKKNNSLRRNDKIDVITKFSKLKMMDKLIVIPAGPRDIKEEGGRDEKGSINSIYASILRNARCMVKGADMNPLYDSVHYTIQKRVIEAYEKIAEMVRGKRGFLEGKYYHRHVARGTRNVVTATNMDAESPDDPQYHKTNEVKVPLFQAAKGGANFLVYWYKTLFYDQVVSVTSENVPLINPKTYNLEYVPIDPKDKDLLTTSEGIEKTIDRFRDPFNRFKPVIVNSNNKPYYMFLVYDKDNVINIIRNLAEFKQALQEAGETFDEAYLRPLTHAEMLYICAFSAFHGGHGLVTRYPITDEQSMYPAETHVITTSPARVVCFARYVKPSPDDVVLPEYPDLNGKFLDALMLHPTRLKSLCADFDGNCVTGSTRIQIRFTDKWIEDLKSLDYSVSKQDIDHVIREILKSKITIDGLNYTDVEIKYIPQPGNFVLDKNGARVYDIPEGAEVLSVKDSVPCWKSFRKMTVEDDCEYGTVRVFGRTVEVSTNPSMAVFDVETGELKKVTPVEAEDKFVPAVIKDPSPSANKYAYEDGWFYGAMVSDGFTSGTYAGYTKLDAAIREAVTEYIKKHVEGIEPVIRRETPEMYKKLGESISLRYNNVKVVRFIESLGMYHPDYPHNALGKQINRDFIRDASEDCLLGLFAGLMDGDGSVVIDSGNCVRFRFATSSKPMVESLKYLGYRLGIRTWVTVVPPRGWSAEAYVVLFRTGDVLKYAYQLKFLSGTNRKKFGMFMTDAKNTFMKSMDMLPISKSEGERLLLFLKNSLDGTPAYTNLKYAIRDGRVRKTTLLKYIEEVENVPSLMNRLAYSDVVAWDKAELVGSVKKGTVYDLLVDDTKVFAVNDGLIIYDTCSWTPIFSEEANKECAEYLRTPGNLILPSGDALADICDDLVKMSMFAMTRDLPDLKK